MRLTVAAVCASWCVALSPLEGLVASAKSRVAKLDGLSFVGGAFAGCALSVAIAIGPLDGYVDSLESRQTREAAVQFEARSARAPFFISRTTTFVVRRRSVLGVVTDSGPTLGERWRLLTNGMLCAGRAESSRTRLRTPSPRGSRICTF